MKWTDTQEIAMALTDAHQDVDPQYVRFTDLHRWITELDPAPATAGAPALAARDCPPLTSEALQAAAQAKPAAGRPARNGTQAAVSRLGRGGS